MNNIDYISGRIKELYRMRQELELEYKNDPTRIKGRAYMKKVSVLQAQFTQQWDKLKSFGTDGTLWRITLMDLETRVCNHCYYINIKKEDINNLCEIRFSGWSITDIQQVKLGQLLG
jgi:hypothetical protein